MLLFRSRSGAVDEDEALRFLEEFHTESGTAERASARARAVREEIRRTGTYRHTPQELEYGARVAWRNSSRCIGRLYWRSLRVRDRRDVADAAGVAAECVAHLREATNDGRVRPVITVFAPDGPEGKGPVIHSDQLVRYAGYPGHLGGVTGDPAGVGATRIATGLGWQGVGGPFDVLPLLVEGRDEPVRWFALPPDAVLEVPLTHPDLPTFAGLGLRWHAVPAVSNMTLEIGGVKYPAAPFNGWYMGTEIGARNLADTDRYDMLPAVADLLGLDTRDDATLWRDRALVELNVAVLHSFREAGVTITDHHTEARRFLSHLAREESAGRTCPADWTWIVPPLSASATPVFHRLYTDADLRPNFVRRAP
ncbi:nitric oxide synthase oxygenase [Actinocorallia sp. A-T 12471]|uniref:nitric oxide synthase oxygenase n=1 Tax=Actinocorallia sp. A-T 12471 TaxID=3089813 RepID=UPI0029CFF9BA|nr:nitric oxide synthase oxygenase [Actinocorallia sp. A-T 12471]MDX6740273.1 nitric oxide synthase oxygenase [Actinocorallia sp. A-T 12471]